MARAASRTITVMSTLKFIVLLLVD
jgi:hypothetical protein